MPSYYVSEIILLLFLPCGLLRAEDTTVSIQPGSRIIGGENANKGEFPFVVALIINKNTACTGSIITEDWVLTAAHCFGSPGSTNPGAVAVIAGSVDYSTETATTKSQRVFKHPDYIDHSDEIKDDIALIQVNKPFDFTGCCIKMAQITGCRFPGVVSMPCKAVGFGKTSNEERHNSELHKLDVSATALAECFKRSNWVFNLFGIHRHRHREASGKLICTEASSGESVCYGDSGGPLVCDGIIAGVLSHMTVKEARTSKERRLQASCTRRRGISVYFYTGAYMSWIREHVPNLPKPGILSTASFLVTTSTLITTTLCLHVVRAHSIG